MSPQDLALLDQILSHSIDIARLSAHEQAKVLELLKQLEQDLTKLLSINVLSDMGKRDTASVLREVTALIQETYTEAALTTQATIAGLGAVSADITAQAMEQVLNITIGKGARPTAGYLEALARDLLIQGSPMADWFSRQAGDVAFRIAAELRTGMALGETNQVLIQRIIGKKGVPGVIDLARKNAAALVQTATATVASSARKAMFEKNKDIGNGMAWCSALDSHTCISCSERDGHWWDWEGKPMDGNTMPFADIPLHVNCRCGWTMRLKPMSEISHGSLPDIPNNGSRASTDGQVPATMNFSEWAKGRTPEQLSEQFGKGRAELFLSGKISIRDMMDFKGNVLTLAQIKAKYGV